MNFIKEYFESWAYLIEKITLIKKKILQKKKKNFEKCYFEIS